MDHRMRTNQEKIVKTEGVGEKAHLNFPIYSGCVAPFPPHSDALGVEISDTESIKRHSAQWKKFETVYS